MKVYEGFAPEVQEVLLGLSPEELDRAPYLRLTLALLKLEMGDASASRRPGVLASAAAVISKSEHGMQAVIASAAIALHLGKRATHTAGRNGLWLAQRVRMMCFRPRSLCCGAVLCRRRPFLDCLRGAWRASTRR